MQQTKTAPELLKAQLPLVRHVENNLKEYGYIPDSPDWHAAFVVEINMYRKFGAFSVE